MPVSTSPDTPRPVRRLLRRGLLLSVALLFVVSIPWYRETGQLPRLWLGLPDWVVVAIACYALAAVANAAAWMVTDVPEASPSDVPEASPSHVPVASPSEGE